MTASGDTTQSIQHHVPDEGLLAHAAGTATEGASLAIACHVALCVACSARVAELEALGGALLETVGSAELRPDALQSVLARLDGAPQQRAAAALPDVPELLRPYGLPRDSASRARARAGTRSLAPGDSRRARDRSAGWRRRRRRPSDRLQGWDHHPAARSRRS